MSIVFILESPTHPGNIAQSIRNAHSMGIDGLRLIDPGSLALAESRLSSEEKYLFDEVMVCNSLEEALFDCTMLIGSTARVGGWRRNVLTLRECAPLIISHERNNNVAVLFGCEKRGIPNEMVAVCDYIFTIPVTRAQKSINLSKAVLLVGYELLITTIEGQMSTIERASFMDFRGICNEIYKALHTIDYFRRGMDLYWMTKLLQPLNRSGMTVDEVAQWQEIMQAIISCLPPRADPPTLNS